MRNIGLAAAAVAAVIGMSGCSEATSDRVAIGQVAPDYAALTLDGDSVQLSDLRGEVVLLNVWATWCGPCREEIPALQEIYESNAAKGFDVVGVSIDGRGESRKIREFADGFGVTYTLWHDPDDRVSSRFRIIGVPATFLIGRDGTLLWRHMGPVTAEDRELNAQIELALTAE